MKKQQTQETNTNNSLLNIITPIGLEIKRNSLIIGENTGRVYGIVKYPQKVDFGWLSKITNIPGTVVGITFIPIDNGEFISGLSRSVIQHRSTAETAKDPLVITFYQILGAFSCQYTYFNVVIYYIFNLYVYFTGGKVELYINLQSQPFRRYFIKNTKL